MQNIRQRRCLLLLGLLALGGVFSTPAQEVSIPDPGLNAAVRAALQKPTGPLTQDDMLSLTHLDASRRNIQSIAGLETASNLVSLDLQINVVTNLSMPGSLRNLKVLDLSANPLTNVVLPNVLSNLTSLNIEAGALTNLTLPALLPALTNLDLENNQLATFNLPSSLGRLVSLNLGFNLLTEFSLPVGLTNLSTFYFAGNPLLSVTLPAGLAGMTDLNLSQNLLTDFTLPPGMTNLEELDLAFNQLTNVMLPSDLFRLSELELDFNRLTKLTLPANLKSLGFLHLRANLFTNFNLATELPALTYLDISESPLTSFALSVPLNQLTTLRLSENRLTQLTLPAGLTNLAALNLSDNLLTNILLPSDLSHLETLLLGGNRLTSIGLPSGMPNLTTLILTWNLLTNITLPPDMTELSSLGYIGDPLNTLVLSDALAGSPNLVINLTDTVGSIQSQGVSVFSYPSTARLLRPRRLIGAIQFGITGPPGTYGVLESSNLASWSVLTTVTNPVGGISFVDVPSQPASRGFYRVVLQGPPTNMVFVAPNTFTMGSPSNDFDHSIDEVPQTTVTLTRGFWIARYEVTQGEYLSVMNTNPSAFTGDLSIAVSSVSWHEATNYCAKLTQRELAAGRIPPGSRYRLPTEAEWECAERAGTMTRFSYGDDPFYASTTNYAWIDSNADLMAHPVGQKLPNPWGLYDMHGNVWEWCQDWFGALPGGVQVNPTGPPVSNPVGYKVMRGGGFDYPNSSCRSASRLFFGAGQFLADWDLGFRVVLVGEP